VEKMNKQQNDYLDYLEKLNNAQLKLKEDVEKAKKNIGVDVSIARQDGNVWEWKEIRDDVSKNDLQFINIDVQKNSIKPGVKVPNNRKKSILNKKALAIGACVLLVAGGSQVPKAVDVVKQNYMVYKEVSYFNEEYAAPNRTFNLVTNDETDESRYVNYYTLEGYKNIFLKSKYTIADPIVAFYLAYDSMGESALNQGIKIFDYYYETDYENVKDFLAKNNFADIKEWKIYVANKLAEQKEEQYGSSNIRG
jgi:hypothetical protein